MRIVAFDPYLPEYTGGGKHGLTLLGVAADKHRVTVLYEQPPHVPPFDPGKVKERFGIDPGRFEFRRVPAWWAVPRHTHGADLFVSLAGSRVVATPAARHMAFITFPERLDQERPANALGWAWQRLQERYHATLDALAPDLFDTPSLAYLRKHGAAGAWKSVPLVALRRAGRRAACDRYHRVAQDLRRYDLLVANSRYTAGWVRKYHGVEAAINYPPIDTPRFRPGPKQRVVLSVGRFAPDPWSKKFEVLIDVFRRLVRAGAADGWTLVCAGSVNGSPASARYLAGLRERAAGLPVEFVVNAPLDELVALNARASVYWHAMGYGEDPEKHPQRFEHFGMTTVEAMAAGCVPMVINAGGQPEIVDHGVHGFLWDTPDALAATFERFVGLPAATVDGFRERASARAEDFGPAAYRRSTAELFERVGVPVD